MKIRVMVQNEGYEQEQKTKGIQTLRSDGMDDILNVIICCNRQKQQNMLGKTVVALIPDVFYFMADQVPPKNILNAFFFNIDNSLVYEPFSEDFGPLNLAMIYKYVVEVRRLLSEPKYKGCRLYHHTSQDIRKASNSALLASAFLLLCMNRTADQAYLPFKNVSFRPFRDASYGQCTFQCTILDCLKGLQYAINLQWFSLQSFNLQEYEKYQRIQNGDINWIIPDKFIAFSCPLELKESPYLQKTLSVKDYVPLFTGMNVSAVIRLNREEYNVHTFKEAGIHHFDMQFTDGSCPPFEIVQQFLSVCEQEKGVIAVHCKAGLGRTGTLIGCYAIKHYHFGAAEYIAWVRMCRPGSVLGPQQYFLVEIAQRIKSQDSPIWRQIQDKVKHLEKTTNKEQNNRGQMSQSERDRHVKGEEGQGNYLMNARIKNNLKK